MIVTLKPLYGGCMSDNKKITDEELAQIKALQAGFLTLSRQFGDLSFQKLVLENALDEAKKQLAALEETRRAFTAKLQEDYGNGTVNLETGEFVPTEQQ
jgi:hypothetical protein